MPILIEFIEMMEVVKFKEVCYSECEKEFNFITNFLKRIYIGLYKK